MIVRRSALGIFGGWLALAAHPAASGEEPSPAPLPPWRPGVLEIHHLATGRGDATLVVTPDGQTALLDAGAVDPALDRPDPALSPALPDERRRPGEWIAAYVGQRLAQTGRGGLDAIVVSHLHPDHVGGVGGRAPLAPNGAYRLTGVSDVAAKLRVDRLLDPDWPDYGDPPFEDVAASENYVAFARNFAARGGSVERLVVGASGQIVRDGRAGGAAFAMRTVAANGRIWTGRGEGSRMIFRQKGRTPQDARPDQNAASAAFLLTWGDFSWFGGGDMTDWADASLRPDLNALTPLARVIGPVDVSTVPHHGMFDAGSSATLHALGARTWIISAWHAAHPAPDVLSRLFHPRLLHGPRDVHVTALHPTVELAFPWLTRRLASRSGHVIVRVEDGGDTWRTYVVEPATGDVIKAGEALRSAARTH